MITIPRRRSIRAVILAALAAACPALPAVGDATGATESSSLQAAVGAGDARATAQLLEAGISPNRPGHLGETALHRATAAPIEIAALLLEAGADANARNAGGVTPLMLAAGRGRAELVDLLLDAGARPEVTDYRSASAADWARRNGHEALAQALERAAARQPASAAPTGYDFADDAMVDVAHPPWFKQSFLDLPEDLAEAREAGKQGIMLFISSRRCSYCKVFLDRALSDPEIQARLRGSFDVIGLDIFSDLELTDMDGRRYPVKDFVTRVKAAFTPTLIFYGEGGRMLLRIVGYYPDEKFARVLDYLEGHHYLNEPLRDYLARSTPPNRAPEPMAVDRTLFRGPPYVFDRRAGRAPRPLLVVFERADCAACERFHERVLGDPSIRELIAGFEAVQLDISDPSERVLTPAGERLTARQWFERLDLTYSPAIVFFDEAGRKAMRLDSETLRYRMEGSLQLVLEKAYERDAQLQRWRRAKAIEALDHQP